jgi:hypothetical protein
MSQYDIYIDTNVGQVVKGLNDSTVAQLPGFIQGDTPNLRIWLLARAPTFPTNPIYTLLGTSGLTLQVTVGDKRGDLNFWYTQQFTWSTDAASAYFYAALTFNTAAINTLIGSGTGASTWLEVKYLVAGIPTTVLEVAITIQAAVNKPVALAVVPAGQTPLSAETALALFLTRTITDQVVWRNSNTGKSFAVYIGDDDQMHVDLVT